MKRLKTSTCRTCSSGKNKRSYHRLYSTWKMMMYRCDSIKANAYHRYGGRGISVDHYFYDFNIFVEYCETLDNCYKDSFTLDRIDSDGNYSKGNLQFTTQDIQTQKSSLLRSTNTTGYRGVTRSRGKYVAQITVMYKHSYIGSFNSAKNAAIAYDKYIIENKLQHTRNFNGWKKWANNAT